MSLPTSGGEDPADFTPGAIPPVPDDARELVRDVELLRRERAATRRRLRVERVFKTRRWHRYGLSGPLVLLCLLVVSVAAGLVALVIPTSGAGPRAARLATNAPKPEGAEGGLLAPAELVLAGRTVPARELRPTALALLPADCRCPALAASVARQAVASELPPVFVATAGDLAQATSLATTAAGGLARAAEDRDDRLARAYAARGVTLLVVRADGVVAAIVHDVSVEDSLAPALSQAQSG